MLDIINLLHVCQLKTGNHFTFTWLLMRLSILSCVYWLFILSLLDTAYSYPLTFFLIIYVINIFPDNCSYLTSLGYILPHNHSLLFCCLFLKYIKSNDKKWHKIYKMGTRGNLAEESDAEITFLPTDTWEIHLHVELLLQNTHWMLAEDVRPPKRQETLGAPARHQGGASEVGEPTSGHWSTRDLPAPRNTKQRKSPRALHLNIKTQLHSTTSKLQCWTPYAKQLARQEHSPIH